METRSKLEHDPRLHWVLENLSNLMPKHLLAMTTCLIYGLKQALGVSMFQQLCPEGAGGATKDFSRRMTG